MKIKDIKKALENAKGQKVKGNPLRRLCTLSTMIYSLLKTNHSRLTNLSKVICPELDFQSRVKKLKRWVSNEYVDTEHFFLPFLAKILENLATRKQILFAIDGSPVGNGCVCLMISLVWRKRAIPLCWLVRRGKKGHFPVEMHLQLLDIFSKLLPPDCKVTLLGDGEFSKIELLEFCDIKGWDVVCRTAKNRLIRLDDKGEKIILGAYLYPEEGIETAWIPNVLYTNKKYGPIHVFCHHDSKHKDPWYLVSNIDYPPQVIRLYKKRFSIETLFGDLKSRGFNVHKSKLRAPDRVSRLLIAVCLAYIFTVLAGLNSKKIDLKTLKKICRQDQPSHFSIFCIGKMLWDAYFEFYDFYSHIFKELLLDFKSVRF